MKSFKIDLKKLCLVTLIINTFFPSQTLDEKDDIHFQY